MMAMTPMGTATRRMTRPLGRLTSRRTWPTGSGRAATCRTPSAIPAIRPSVRASRSSITSLTCPRAASISCALAARMAAAFRSRASAMASRAAFFSSVEVRWRAGRASRAESRMSWVVIIAKPPFFR